MSHILELSDEVYRALELYAQERHQSPEEALASLVRGIALGNGNGAAGASAPDETPGANGSETQAEYLDPWEGFRGKYTADVPDLTLNHDTYLAEAYLDTHDTDE